MTRLYAPPSRRRGSALAMAVVMALVLAALGTYLLVPIRKTGELQLADVHRIQARSLAESALDVAVHRLRTAVAPAAGHLRLVTGERETVFVETVALAELPGGWLLTSTCALSALPPQTVTVTLAIQLGDADADGLRPVVAHARGRTAAVAEALR